MSNYINRTFSVHPSFDTKLARFAGHPDSKFKNKSDALRYFLTKHLDNVKKEDLPASKFKREPGEEGIDLRMYYMNSHLNQKISDLAKELGASRSAIVRRIMEIELS